LAHKDTNPHPQTRRCTRNTHTYMHACAHTHARTHVRTHTQTRTCRRATQQRRMQGWRPTSRCVLLSHRAALHEVHGTGCRAYRALRAVPAAAHVTHWMCYDACATDRLLSKNFAPAWHLGARQHTFNCMHTRLTSPHLCSPGPHLSPALHAATSTGSQFSSPPQLKVPMHDALGWCPSHVPLLSPFPTSHLIAYGPTGAHVPLLPPFPTSHLIVHGPTGAHVPLLPPFPTSHLIAHGPTGAHVPLLPPFPTSHLIVHGPTGAHVPLLSPFSTSHPKPRTAWARWEECYG